MRIFLSSAYHAAEYQRLQQVSDIYQYYKYMTRHDERVRPAHASLHGKIFRYNDPIWKSVYPPNGWNCRCYVTPLTLEEMQAEGTYVPPVESEHHRTEFIKTVPEEFRRNPGLEEHIFTKWAEQKFKDMPTEKADEIKRKVDIYSEKSNAWINQPRKFKSKFKKELIEINNRQLEINNEKFELSDNEKAIIKTNNVKLYTGNSNYYSHDKRELIINPDTPKNLFHELGHMINEMNNSLYSNRNSFIYEDDFQNIFAKKKEQNFEIIRERLLTDNTNEFTKTILANANRKELKEYLSGQSSMPKSYLAYIKSASEIFAEGYMQWRLNPQKFKNYAIDYFEYFNKINQKLKKNG